MLHFNNFGHILIVRGDIMNNKRRSLEEIKINATVKQKLAKKEGRSFANYDVANKNFKDLENEVYKTIR